MCIKKRFRTALEHHFATKEQIPIVLVALNGGPNTIKTLVEGIQHLRPLLLPPSYLPPTSPSYLPLLSPPPISPSYFPLHLLHFSHMKTGAKKKFPIIIVDKSGRACDAMAAFIKHKTDNTYSTPPPLLPSPLPRSLFHYSYDPTAEILIVFQTTQVGCLEPDARLHQRVAETRRVYSLDGGGDLFSIFSFSFFQIFRFVSFRFVLSFKFILLSSLETYPPYN